MKRWIVLYNPIANKGKGKKNAEKILEMAGDTEVRFEDMTAIEDLSAWIGTVPEDTDVIFTGGDGTLNRVINAVDGKLGDRILYYFPAGSGNDFLRDIHRKPGSEPFPINEYTQGLPTVVVNDAPVKFINAIGFGLDGYCCEVNDQLAARGKSRSYAMIAVQGLLGGFRPCGGTVTVDGVTKRYKKIWMAPTMFGSFFGGGFNMDPTQDRKNPEHTVTCITVHSVLRGLTPFFFLFVMKGKGRLLKRYADYRRGSHVVVEFDRPNALQIDGETVLGVTRYEVMKAELPPAETVKK